MGYADLVQMIVEDAIKLSDLYVAKLRGELDLVLEQANDPPLRESVDRFRGLTSDARILHGLTQLLELAPAGARLSWLLNAKNISRVCATAIAEGRKPNSVKRSLYRAISDLLSHEVGKARKAAIMMDVTTASQGRSRCQTRRPLPGRDGSRCLVLRRCTSSRRSEVEILTSASFHGQSGRCGSAGTRYGNELACRGSDSRICAMCSVTRGSAQAER